MFLKILLHICSRRRIFFNVVMGYADMPTDMYGGVCRNVQPVYLFYEKRSK